MVKAQIVHQLVAIAAFRWATRGIAWVPGTSLVAGASHVVPDIVEFFQGVNLDESIFVDVNIVVVGDCHEF